MDCMYCPWHTHPPHPACVGFSQSQREEGGEPGWGDAGLAVAADSRGVPNAVVKTMLYNVLKTKVNANLLMLSAPSEVCRHHHLRGKAPPGPWGTSSIRGLALQTAPPTPHPGRGAPRLAFSPARIDSPHFQAAGSVHGW